jgi:hypothetical protein
MAIKPQLDELYALGMNVVRLPIIWKALEPTPNPHLDELMPEARLYLQCVSTIINELYSRGLFVIIDFHQDIAHESYSGDGFADWALGIDPEHPRPMLSCRVTVSHCRAPATCHLDDSRWGTTYYNVPSLDKLFCACGARSTAVRNTLTSFWKDDLINTDQTDTERSVYLATKPQTHFVKTVGQVARFFASQNDGWQPCDFGLRTLQ